MKALMLFALAGTLVAQNGLNCTYFGMDLSPLKGRSFNTTDPVSTYTTYQISVCGNTAYPNSTCVEQHNNEDASVFQVLAFNGACYLISSWDENPSDVTKTEHGFSVTFQNGEDTLCQNSQGQSFKRSMRYNFICDEAEVGTLGVMKEEDICSYSVDFPTKYACADTPTPGPSSDCSFTVGDKSYDLSALQGRGGAVEIVPEDEEGLYKYEVTFCQDKALCQGNVGNIVRLRDSGLYACLGIYGKWSSGKPYPLNHDGFSVDFTSTEYCSDDFSIMYSSTFEFVCSQGEERGNMTARKGGTDSCVYIITVPTKYACDSPGPTPPPSLEMPDAWFFEQQNAMVDLFTCQIDPSSTNSYGYIEPFTVDLKQGCFADINPTRVATFHKASNGSLILSATGFIEWLFIVDPHGFLVHWEKFAVDESADWTTATSVFELAVVPHSLTPFAYDSKYGLWQGMTKITNPDSENIRDSTMPGPYHTLLYKNAQLREAVAERDIELETLRHQLKELEDQQHRYS